MHLNFLSNFCEILAAEKRISTLLAQQQRSQPNQKWYAQNTSYAPPDIRNN